MAEIKCRLLEKEPPLKDQVPGDMWPCPHYLDHGEDGASFWLAPEYLRGNRKNRMPMMLVLPGGVHWLIDGKASGTHGGWTVTGEAPKFTAHPSIQTVNYHGWLKDGVLKEC